MIRVQICTMILTALLHAATNDWNIAATPTLIGKQFEAGQQPAILADTLLDSPSDHSKAKRMLLAMIDGKYTVEQEPGPFTGPQWTGTFELQLLDQHQQIIATARLNEAFDELLFQRPFSIQFADYNHDGHPDFAIGQYASSNLYHYRLFTIQDDKIKELPIKSDRDIISSERDYSVLFAKTGPASFQTVFYDNSVGKYMKRVYEWKGNAFERVLETEWSGEPMSFREK
ncbi:hypothetical protein NDK47_09005 [Brevibacillus ruminantium]|uniref:VCBS repeat-containing protein n=1 Tax=Brevibacillus ruminantium TaxID=2950604 RepID=A0ABY4WJV1_9BACL|nr:hypothetical protein [Brevibacillus ruminantium]USG67392.1 hypothetical protein NDK47_09005 [Brevibacillus ruminantium]